MPRSALLIACGEYQDVGLARLGGPTNDAEGLAEVLADPNIGAFDVQTLMNEPEGMVRREIGRFFADRGRDDLLLLYITGHGLKDVDGGLYFAATDTDRHNLAASALSAEFVNQQMTRSRSRAVVLILDCCYGGAFRGPLRPKADDGLDIQERLRGRGRVVITASSALEYAFEGDELSGSGTSSAFTDAIIKGLRTGDADIDGDGWIDTDELYEYTWRSMKGTSPHQTPTKTAETSGLIVLARNPAVRVGMPDPQPPSLALGPLPAIGKDEPAHQGTNNEQYTAEPILANDYWTVGDKLDYQFYADAIAEFVLHHETRPPLTIGIKAPWGAGKTSLMRMVQDLLDPLAPGTNGATSSRQPVALTEGSRRIVGERLVGRAPRLAAHRPEAGRAAPFVTNRTLLRRLRRKAEQPPQSDADRDGQERLQAEPMTTQSWRPTVWFNPWMYQSGEQIWAGLANEVISQITDRMPLVERESFWLELNLRRVDAEAVRRRIHLALFTRLLPLAAGFALTLLAVLTLALLRLLVPQIAEQLQVAAGGLLATGTVGIAAAGAARTGSFWREHVAGSLRSLLKPPDYVRNWQKLIGEQAPSALAQAVRNPGYESRLGFLYLVQTDMRHVLELVATPERPIVIFVDDLDRCSPSTVTQVIEAINLFLAGQFPNCVFMVAMEPGVVAAHIEVAYKDLFSTPAGDDYWEEGPTLGWRFLDKIIQLPISLPVLRSDQVGAFLGTSLASVPTFLPMADRSGLETVPVQKIEDAIGQQRPALDGIGEAAARAQQRLSGSAATADGLSAETRLAMRRVLRRRLNPDSPEVQEVVTAVAGRLTNNPREIKRFVNVFRFYTVIRQEREMTGLPVPDNLSAIAKLAVLAVRWPHLRSALGRQIGPTERDTVLSLLEEPITELGGDDDWTKRRTALHAVLSKADIPERLRSELLASEDLCALLACDPPIGRTAAGYL